MNNYIQDRLKESSTIRGIIIALAGLAGYALTEADAVQLIAAGNILAGIIGAALPDKIPSP
ncbi:MAG: hypothetical protein ACOYMG_17620 [Candidatus Methylumidiphilus sp.]